MPKLSIIMGVYNCEDTIKMCINSILNQTFQDWEFIICDDCSSDQTLEIVKDYAAQDNRIVVLQNQVNSKLSATLNHCLSVAKGEYVARMDADDMSCPDRFERQIQFLNDHPDIHVLGTAMQRFNADGLADIVDSVSEPNYYTLKKKIPYHHATIMMRKTAYDALHGYTVSKRTVRGQDYDLWFRFYKLGFKGSNLKEPLYLVREDMAAIKRRTIKVRWNTYKTTVYGFRLLKYPITWLVKPTIVFVIKAIIPYQVYALHRKWLKTRYEKEQKR